MIVPYISRSIGFRQVYLFYVMVLFDTFNMCWQSKNIHKSKLMMILLMLMLMLMLVTTAYDRKGSVFDGDCYIKQYL